MSSPFAHRLVVVRGGGDLASGVVFQFWSAGFQVVVLELPKPLAIRRTVSFASAVFDASVEVEGIKGVRAGDLGEALALASDGHVPVLASPTIPDCDPFVVVDARVAKRNIDTRADQASHVVALGPGFEAPVDCHAVVETERGHDLGRVITRGSAAPDTGVPGRLGGESAGRVLRAPTAGSATWGVDIGDLVDAGAPIGTVGGEQLSAPTSGVVRGLIHPDVSFSEGTKIADIDPRGDDRACRTISDKARLVGSGALTAVLTRTSR